MNNIEKVAKDAGAAIEVAGKNLEKILEQLKSRHSAEFKGRFVVMAPPKGASKMRSDWVKLTQYEGMMTISGSSSSPNEDEREYKIKSTDGSFSYNFYAEDSFGWQPISGHVQFGNSVKLEVPFLRALSSKTYENNEREQAEIYSD